MQMVTRQANGFLFALHYNLLFIIILFFLKENAQSLVQYQPLFVRL